jgi:hypothetical protein
MTDSWFDNLDISTIFNMPQDSPTVKEDGICCGQEMVYNSVEALKVCVNCGRCFQYFEVTRESVLGGNVSCHIRYKSIYKPVKHFDMKLREIMGLLVPEKNYSSLFEPYDIETIRDIRKVLKSKKLTKLYKFSYFFFTQKTKRKLFNLKQAQVNKIKREFIKINLSFRRHRNNIKRHNLLPYHFILKKILESMNINTSGLCDPRLLISIEKNETIWAILVPHLSEFVRLHHLKCIVCRKHQRQENVKVCVLCCFCMIHQHKVKQSVKQLNALI